MAAGNVFFLNKSKRCDEPLNWHDGPPLKGVPRFLMVVFYVCWNETALCTRYPHPVKRSSFWSNPQEIRLDYGINDHDPSIKGLLTSYFLAAGDILRVPLLVINAIKCSCGAPKKWHCQWVTGFLSTPIDGVFTLQITAF